MRRTYSRYDCRGLQLMLYGVSDPPTPSPSLGTKHETADLPPPSLLPHLELRVETYGYDHSHYGSSVAGILLLPDLTRLRQEDLFTPRSGTNHHSIANDLASLFGKLSG